MEKPDTISHSYDFRTAGKPAEDKKRGALRRVEIEIAENGYEVECRYKPPERKPDPKAGKGTMCEPCCNYESLTSRFVFKTAQEVGRFIEGQLR